MTHARLPVVISLLLAGCGGPHRAEPPAPVTQREAIPLRVPALDAPVELGDEQRDEHGDLELATCSTAVRFTERWPPALTLTSEEHRRFATGIREYELAELCKRSGWSLAARDCMTHATPTTIVGCIGMLGAAQRRDVAARITELDALVARSLDRASKPATNTCGRLVAEHYRDDRWKAMSAAISGPERARVIAESRARMLAWCTVGRWEPTLLACLLSGGADACFSYAGGFAGWGLPARGVLFDTGIAACDTYARSSGTPERAPPCRRASGPMT
jgi:hypothetical protein